MQRTDIGKSAARTDDGKRSIGLAGKEKQAGVLSLGISGRIKVVKNLFALSDVGYHFVQRRQNIGD